MKTVMNPGKASAVFVLGLAFTVTGIYVSDADDAPGAAVVGGILMVSGVVLGVKAARGRLPVWAGRTALAVGAIVAVLAAFLIHGVNVRAALFPQPQEVPSAVASAPSQQYVAGVERAREIVRVAVLNQNLPGVSIAVGVSGTVVWAEGFGWRDVLTEAPVTPDTRFNIGTAGSAISPAVATLGLTNTGTDSAADWSPSHNGEPEDDFPPFVMIRRHIFVPIGLASPDQPIPGNRATFYVPRSDNNPRTGRWLMYMRDLACCAPNKMAFYSTPSDLVRFALATNPDNLNGDLAGGMVMSLMTTRESGIVVAVTSNISHANTLSLAQQIADAFAPQTR